MKPFRKYLGLTLLLPALSQADPFGGQIGFIAENGVQNDALVSKIPESDPAGSDLLRWENGDIMHGEFDGMAEGLLWRRNDMEQVLRFPLKGIRQIIFNAAKSAELTKGTSFITLISGDRIPGKIISLNDQELGLESSIAGTMSVPRELIKSIAPNPFEGELIYAGPFTSDGWMRLSYPETLEEAGEVEGTIAPTDSGESEPKEEKKETPPSWFYSGAAFYCISRHPLVFDAGLPDVGRLRFKVYCKSQLSLAVALHSDFTRPVQPNLEGGLDVEKPVEPANPAEGAPGETEEEKPEVKYEKITDYQKGTEFQEIPWLRTSRNNNAESFGTGYILNISSYLQLTSNTFNEDGGANPMQRVQTSRSSSSIPQSGIVDVDIRFDRNKALIMLFINGEYVTQWTDPAGYIGKGTGIGFLNSNSSAIRISDILVTTWNGSLDSAKSMESPDRDIALLTNGTDRFSGELTKIEDEMAFLKTNYAEIKVPLGDLSEIVMKENGTADPEDPKWAWPDDSASIVFKPYGFIKMIPESAVSNEISGSSPFLGKIKVDLESAVMLRLQDESPDLSDWFDNDF